MTETKINYKDLTLETLVKENPDLVEEIRNTIVESIEIENMKTEHEVLTEENARLEHENRLLRELISTR
jgi:regulator of replication initiation timing